MGDRWVLVTPEVSRPPAGFYGDGAMIAAKRMSPRKTPGKKEAPKSRWSALKRILGLIPWGALLAVSLMMTGLVMHLVNSKKTANNSLSLTKVTQSENVGYPYRLHVFSGSYAVTAGLAAGCIVASCILALVRLKQKLIHEEKNKENWGQFKFRLYYSICILSFIAILLPIIWFGLNVMFLSAWGMGLWTLRDSAKAASISMQQAGTSGTGASNPNSGSVQADNMVCPTVACFNLNYFVWLESNVCLCNQQLISSLQDGARLALAPLVWALAGLGCLLFGSLLATAQGAADLALMRADWKWTEIIRSKPDPSPVRRAPFDPSYALTPGMAFQKQPPYGVGYYARTPQQEYMD